MDALKKIMKSLLGLVVGCACGFGAVMLIRWLADGGKPIVEKTSEGTDYGLLALCIFLAFIFLIVGTIIHLIIHEAGHLVTGLLTGYRFLSFRVFKFTLAKTNNGLQWKRFHISGTGGQCLMELPEDQDVNTAPWFWYNAGGVLMNLLLAFISILLLRNIPVGIVAFSFFIMLAFVGIGMALINGLPIVAGGLGNDGYNILSLWKYPELRRYFVHTLQIAGQLSRGKRMREMPGEWMEDIPVNKDCKMLELGNRINYMALLEDQGRMEEALDVADEIMSLGRKLPQLYQMEVGGERVMLELLTSKNTEKIGEQWTKQLERYILLNSKYSPIKCAILYSYELIYRHDEEKAETYRQSLLLHQNDYAMPGEARTAISLVETAMALDRLKIEQAEKSSF